MKIDRLKFLFFCLTPLFISCKSNEKQNIYAGNEIDELTTKPTTGLNTIYLKNITNTKN